MNEYKVLLVDDDPNILASISRHLHGEYPVITAGSGLEALQMVDKEKPIALMISDFQMPVMTGVELATRMQAVSPDTVRILLTGNADLDMAINAINDGHIFRFLLKPCPKATLLQTVAAGITQYCLVMAERELLDQTLKGSIKVLVEVLAMTNPEIFNRSTHLRGLVRNLALRLGYPDLWEVELAISLCQIGCVTLPKEVLRMKSLNRFASEADRLAYYQHPKIGKSLVGNIPRLEAVAAGIAYQYKWFDGKGIPADEVKGEEIPWLGRLLKVVLDYDELVQAEIKKDRAIQIMAGRRGQYDERFFIALSAEVIGMKGQGENKAIAVSQLEAGMTLAADITDVDGRVLITQNTLVTDVLRIRLENYGAYHQILGPVFINT